ncbi:LysM peptidoglycan-binding domain-containing protein [Cellulosilyticum ruminicola]|uniref:LysM peptidoglycan-binding domain-containing protein n=1 Tax=Cellulosilyticum ruminicola TaxID=425254 RepID=UPI0006CF34B5|nr:LysM peptidoglycan-binding domain-containing protein [Cellulosilyticum ruminicola]
MGKISYRPSKGQSNKSNKNTKITNLYDNSGQDVSTQNISEEIKTDELVEEHNQENDFNQEDILEQTTEDEVAITSFSQYNEITETIGDIEVKSTREVPNKSRQEKKKLDNVKMIGDMDCEFHIYMEDYVYTYIYQYAYSDLSKESAAILIGEVYLDSKEAMITGMIPVDVNKLTDGSEWINLEVVNEIEEKRKEYFADQDIIGWLHMQPGYGTMLTMKELREHRSVFEGTGSVFMLVDALNKVETVYVYEDEELKEQSGYCMYYEPNEPMQKYMVEHPFAKKETEEIKDTVVNQFREIGKIRKEEYLQKKNTSFTIMAVAIALVALTGIIVRMNDAKGLGSNQITAVMSNSVNDVSDKEGSNNQQTAVNNTLGKEIGTVTDEIQISSDVSNVDETNTSNTDEESVPTITGEEIVGEDDKQDEVTLDTNKVDEASNADQTSKEEKSSSAEEEYDIYVVKQGDTLANISYDKYGNAKKSLEIAKLNGLDSTNNIYVGQELKMPKK